MYSICKKEIGRSFSSLTGYIAIILFLLVCGLFLFVLPGSNILENNYASLDKFFALAPWVLLFLIPAVTMHSFSDEFKTGTYELLKTRPLTSWQIVGGKYLSVLLVIIFVIIPTFIYIFCVKTLSNTGTLDYGSIAGSYTGLFLIAAVFASVSLCRSSFTSNAVVAFLLSGFINLILYFGFSAASKIAVFTGAADFYIELIGIDFHYRSISRGVADTRDIIYFLSVIFLSLSITVKNISRK